MTDALNLTFTDSPLNPLEVALNDSLAPPADMGLFEALLLGEDLYAVPQPGSFGSSPTDGQQTIRPGQDLVLRGLRMKDGRDTVALFTDPQRVAQIFGAEAVFIAVQGLHLFNLLQDAVILINPARGRGVMMTPDQIKAVLARAPARMG
jgi:hypothetical protein